VTYPTKRWRSQLLCIQFSIQENIFASEIPVNDAPAIYKVNRFGNPYWRAKPWSSLTVPFLRKEWRSPRGVYSSQIYNSSQCCIETPETETETRFQFNSPLCQVYIKRFNTFQVYIQEQKGSWKWLVSGAMLAT
jgi:hypothetical protein